ncbi:MAG TPA: hypothetical protein VFN02_14890 [Ktedonobacteraceae bacterium]|nr:hypothetical protein [Ktedonobacteraceae bacterium]
MIMEGVDAERGQSRITCRVVVSGPRTPLGDWRVIGQRHHQLL